jgi:hypothetical protein
MNVVGEYLGLYVHGLRYPELLRSGAIRDETQKPLPGDNLVPKAFWQVTRAETILAPAEAVWPWLLQLGYGRGGYYAWFPLSTSKEFRKDTLSADRILPEFQHLQVGDALLDGPRCAPQKGAWIVKSIEPCRSLVLLAARRISLGSEPLPDFRPEAERPAGMHFLCSWAFVLEPAGAGHTRLLVRSRASGGPLWMIWFMRLVFGNGDTVMQRTMLQGIKERAERGL